LTGGTYAITNGGVLYDVNGGNITELGTGTRLTVDSSASIQTPGTSDRPLSHLKTIDAGASLTLLAGDPLITDPGFENNGNLTIDGGGLIVTAGGFTNEAGGIVSLDQGGALYTPGFNNLGTLTLNHGSTADFRGGTFTAGGTITLSGNSVIYYDGTPGAIAGMVDLSGGGEVVANDGCGAPPLPACAELGGLANTGYFDLSTSTSILGSTPTNSGDFRIDQHAWVTLSGGAGFTNMDGTLRVDGTLFAPVDLEAGMLEGTGTVGDGAGTGVEQDGGVVKPGHSPGILTINGDYIQLAGGVLEIDFEDPSRGIGAGWGFLHVTGNASLDGSLELEFLNPDLIATGLYEIMDYASLSPGHANMTLIDPGQPGWYFNLIYNTNELDLSISDTTPEPASWALLLGGAGLLSAFRKASRRRQGR
jgi:fibronectin-binding autotransporter adhesin